MTEQPVQLDITIEIVTPENIAFRYQVAGPFRRLPAYLIDMAIRIGVAAIAGLGLAIVFGLLGMPGVGMGIWLLLWFLLAWFYGGLFETFWNGQTPGKRLMRIRVLSVEGQPVTGLQAVLRNLLRAADIQPAPFYMVGLLTASMNDRFQRLGDLVCGTMVVVEEPRTEDGHWGRGAVSVGQPLDDDARRLVAEVPAAFQASRTLGRALGAYVQRRRLFPPGRRLEIARHLGEPLRQRFGLPVGTNLDALLVAAYHRTFITDRAEELPIAPPRNVGSPFQALPVVVADGVADGDSMEPIQSSEAVR